LLAAGPRGQAFSPSLWQTWHALKLQDKPQRYSHVNRFNFAIRRSVELLFDMLPRRSLSVTIRQMTLTTHTHFTDAILRAGLNYQFH
jgi:hypothetical protein